MWSIQIFDTLGLTLPRCTTLTESQHVHRIRQAQRGSSQKLYSRITLTPLLSAHYNRSNDAEKQALDKVQIEVHQCGQ
uniref:Uncharacterized protein n=1 Tax=Physcomitrium patens TaxID=3218 RepID=A0A2K1II62_PHYPA|nr:hypothetical protein PHYPA_027657 [Physcomitrium patens]